MPERSLAERAVACPGFRWMPGMADENGCRLIDWRPPLMRWTGNAYGESGDRYFGTVDHEDGPAYVKRLPDLDDHATLGCLLALVREAWGCDGATTQDRRRGGQGWWVWLSDPNKFDTPVREAPTEAEALVSALETAPPREASGG